MPPLHRDAFVMDGHTHVMTRELLLGTDIGQRYPDGNVDLPRAKEGGVDAMFFSVYTPENYYPGRFETKNTFRVVELALDQIKKNENAIELALNASDIDRINKSGRIAAFLDLEGGYDLHGDLNLLRALHRLGLRSMQLTAHNTTNAFIDACNDVYTWGGINDHGRAVIKEMNDSWHGDQRRSRLERRHHPDGRGQPPPGDLQSRRLLQDRRSSALHQ